MLEHDWVSVIASDSHNTKGRAPKMREASEWIDDRFGAERVRKLFVDGPAQLCGIG
jgi:tyrosine-protein phosphatase YwqE